MIIAVIPARGGSKRIPRKNIRLFEGKPIIAWSIEAALNAGCFDRVIVSTDDEEIAAVAKAYGAEVPFMRPTTLADDYSGTAEVVRHVITEVNNLLTAAAADGVVHSVVSAACCIYATAPFLRADDIQKGLGSLCGENADYALAITEFEFPVQRAVKLDAQHRITMLYPEFSQTRSQDLEKSYHDAGQFCWGTSEAWLFSKPVYQSKTAAVLIPSSRVQDIDNEDDWQRAELMFRALQS